jgi:hypothetical protein
MPGSRRSWTVWRRLYGDAVMVLLLGLLAVAVLLAVTSGCTIERVILYETITYPIAIITPIGRIGPS